MAFAWDTFVEASDTALASHTPTGSNAGSGWTLISGGVSVIGGANYIEETNSSSGNRFGMNTNIGTEDMNVSMEITLSGAPVAGDFIFPGLIARMASASGSGLEFDYDFNISGGSWNLYSVSVPASWPGGTVLMELRCRGADTYGFVNGVQVISFTDTLFRGNTYAGLKLGNFTGSSKRSRGSNFRANPATASVFYVTA